MITGPADEPRAGESRFVVVAYRRDLAEILGAVAELRENLGHTMAEEKTIPLADARALHDGIRQISVVLGQVALAVAQTTDGWSVAVPEIDSYLRLVRVVETATAFLQPPPEAFSDLTDVHADALDDLLDGAVTAIGRYRRSLGKIRTDRPDGGRIAHADGPRRPDN